MNKRRDCGRCGRLWSDAAFGGHEHEIGFESSSKQALELSDLKNRYQRILRDYLLDLSLHPDSHEETFEEAETWLRSLDRRFAA